MPTTIVIESKESHPAEDLWDHLEAEDGVVTDTTRIETQEQLADGDLCTVHRCRFNGSDAVLKVCKERADNDLVENEAQVLTELVPPGTPESKFYRYLPRILHSATHQGRQVNVLPYFEGFVSMAEIQRAFPRGISHLDAVWMLRRTLEGIGFVHERGFVHGALTLDHILVHPESHGAKLIDWSYAVAKDKAHVKAISTAYRALYPPEVYRKEKASSALDVYMAARCYVALIRGNLRDTSLPVDMPGRLRDFVQTLLLQDVKYRASNAWTVYEDLDQVLRETVGPRTYRPFEMPRT